MHKQFECKACESNKYQDEAGGKACKSCAAGQLIKSVGQGCEMTAAPTPAPVAVEMVEVSVTLASETVATFQGARVVQFISAMGRALGVDADRITVKSIAPVNVKPVRRRLNEAADVAGGSDMKLGIVVHVQIKLVAHTETVSVLAVMESAGFKKSLVEKMGSAGLAVRGAAALLRCCPAALLLCCPAALLLCCCLPTCAMACILTRECTSCSARLRPSAAGHCQRS
jgi:hypothetical protein